MGVVYSQLSTQLSMTMSSRLVLHINHSPPSLAGMETAIHQKSKPTEDHENLRATPPMPPRK